MKWLVISCLLFINVDIAWGGFLKQDYFKYLFAREACLNDSIVFKYNQKGVRWYPHSGVIKKIDKCFCGFILDSHKKNIYYGSFADRKFDVFYRKYLPHGHKFKGVSSIDADEFGNVFVADLMRKYIYKFKYLDDSLHYTGVFNLKSIVKDFMPFDIAVDNAGTISRTSDDVLFVVDPHSCKIIKLDLDGRLIATYDGADLSLARPRRIMRGISGYCNTDRLYVLDHVESADGDYDKIVCLVEKEGKLVWKNEHVANPGERYNSMTRDWAGNVYIAEINGKQILRFDPELNSKGAYDITANCGYNAVKRFYIVDGTMDAFVLEPWSDSTGIKKFKLNSEVSYSVDRRKFSDADSFCIAVDVPYLGKLNINIKNSDDRSSYTLFKGESQAGTYTFPWRSSKQNEKIKYGNYRVVINYSLIMPDGTCEKTEDDFNVVYCINSDSLRPPTHLQTIYSEENGLVLSWEDEYPGPIYSHNVYYREFSDSTWCCLENVNSNSVVIPVDKEKAIYCLKVTNVAGSYNESMPSVILRSDTYGPTKYIFNDVDDTASIKLTIQAYSKALSNKNISLLCSYISGKIKDDDGNRYKNIISTYNKLTTIKSSCNLNLHECKVSRRNGGSVKICCTYTYEVAGVHNKLQEAFTFDLHNQNGKYLITGGTSLQSILYNYTTLDL